MHTGFEIDMLSVGNGDCLLITGWDGLTYETVLIDGGRADSYKKLRAFLQKRGISHLHHVVSTHPHEDHIAGLIELLKDTSIGVGRLYIHWPFNFFATGQISFALSKAAGTQEAADIKKALGFAMSLTQASTARHIPWDQQPFQGLQIGALTVVGPSEAFYREAAAEIIDSDRIREFDRANQEYLRASGTKEEVAKEILAGSTLIENPTTAPINNTSVILAMRLDNGIYLFTADGGVPALSAAACAYPELKKCYFMQLPHHGSRRNINPYLITHFAPSIALVSAEGSLKHPRRAVVSAFKKIGTKVYSTHWPEETNWRLQEREVPSRPEYTIKSEIWIEPEKPVPAVPPQMIQTLARFYENR